MCALAFLFLTLLFIFQVDGLLFFHREALYISGVTPLILWLKTNMLSDMLGVKVDTLPKEEKGSPNESDISGGSLVS